MKTSSFLRKYWLGVLAFFLLVAAVLFSFVIPEDFTELDNKLNNATILIGWALFFIQYLYNRSEKFYIHVNSIRLWLTNETVTWDFSIDLGNCSHDKPMSRIWKTIKDHDEQAIKWHLDQDSLIADLSGYTIRVFVGEGVNSINEMKIICIQVSNLKLPFRTFKQKIENEIIPLIKEISKLLNPAMEKYAAKISFASTNPYFGFFVRRLELPKVISFTCDFLENSVGRHDQVVTVRKDRIDIVTDDLLTLQTLSMKYMALST